MKEFSNVRELIGQIGLDLQAKAGSIGSTFRKSIRRELSSFDEGEKDVKISIEQVSGGSLISLHIGDWVEPQKKIKYERQFRSLVRRLGATPTGICRGVMPGALATFLNEGAR
jgi:hypothetical protein